MFNLFRNNSVYTFIYKPGIRVAIHINLLLLLKYEGEIKFHPPKRVKKVRNL